MLNVLLSMILFRGHSFITYAPKGLGGSSAMRTRMYFCHSDVIICAYRVGARGGSEIREFVRT